MSMLAYKISTFTDCVQKTLFPRLEEAGLQLTPKLHRLVEILELLRIEEFVKRPSSHVRGVKPKDRRCLARAFVAFYYYGGNDRNAFCGRLLVDANLRKVCGWEYSNQVPSPSTFCRAFKLFAETTLADSTHVSKVKEWYNDVVVWHSAIDSSAISVRERPAKRPKKDAASPKEKKKPGPRGKDAPPADPVELTRLQRQIDQEPEISLIEIPTVCDWGTKKSSKGKEFHWTGYKLHAGVTERGVPMIGITTSASLHDSQVAIIIMKTIHQRVETVFYDLGDKAYDAAPIRQVSDSLGHCPIIDRKKRRGEMDIIPMEPDRAETYKGRTAVERFFARIKDEVGGDNIRVRGHAKVHAHLMFGLLVIFADQLLRIT
jgi:hypothetical protein